MIDSIPCEPCITLLTASIGIRVLYSIMRVENPSAIGTCEDNVLLWNTILYCFRSLSKPFIPFELVHSISLPNVIILNRYERVLGAGVLDRVKNDRCVEVWRTSYLQGSVVIADRIGHNQYHSIPGSSSCRL